MAKRARGGTPPAHHGSHPVGRRPRSRPPARRSTSLELTFLPGLGDVLADEASEVLMLDGAPTAVPGREDALDVSHWGPLTAVLDLRTAVAAFVVLRFDVPRPKSLTSGDHLQRIVDAMYSSLRVGSSSSFRFEAAGSDSTVFARLAELLAEATGLRYDEAQGELVLRVRRGARPGASGDPGWDVLVRIGARPLSARRWRVADYPGAANATIAAAMVRLGGVEAEDRVLNLMCGSGTLLVERLSAGPAAEAIGVDLSADALTASSENLGAAAVDAALVNADCTGPALTEAVGTGWDLLLADPPWGDLHGTHATSAEVHAGMLQAAYDVAAPGARFVVLTHEVKVMERCLRDADALWRVRSTTRVFAKGHHPRIYVLDRT
ncbi:methyltransferase [Cellulomonas sp. Leaf334]|uniref:methyltransferase n=1 Tax=Cellulomonas sp. Leaf334 TaxID=1736339 RepID=UPI000B091A87|nr:methyltransferase [Cellulomonas sp. Leaf334]